MDALQFLNSFIKNRDDFHQPVIPLLIAFAAGLVCGEQFYLSRWVSGVSIAVGLGFISLWIIRKQPLTTLPLVLFYFLGWFCMTGFAFSGVTDNHIIRLAGETPWTITGTIVDTPAYGPGPGRQILFVKPNRLDCGQRQIRPTGNLQRPVH